MSTETQAEIDPQVLEAVRADMAELAEELTKELPQISIQLERINKNLRPNPELVLLLDDDEIAPFYQAYMRMAEVQKLTKPAKKGGSKKPPAADANGNLFADML